MWKSSQDMVQLLKVSMDTKSTFTKKKQHKETNYCFCSKKIVSEQTAVASFCKSKQGFIKGFSFNV